MPPRNRTITAKRVTEEVTLTETTGGPLFPAAYRDQLAADWGPDGVAAFGDAAEAVAREAVFGPCQDPLLRSAAVMPDMLP